MPFMHRWLIERSVLFFFFFNIFGRFLYSYGVVFFTDFYRVFFSFTEFLRTRSTPKVLSPFPQQLEIGIVSSTLVQC